MSYSVNYDAVEELACALGDLADEFEGLEDHMEGYGDAVAHEGVAEGLEEAGGNWEDDREEIVEIMRNAAEFARQASCAYRDADTGLAGELDNAGAA